MRVRRPTRSPISTPWSAALEAYCDDTRGWTRLSRTATGIANALREAHAVSTSASSTAARTEHRVAIALGSNIGDRQGNLVAALQRLRTVVRIDRISSVYDTLPVGFRDQPNFLNLVCTGYTVLAPHELRNALAAIERQVGRQPGTPLGPRAIDLDLLLYGDLVLADHACTIPHPGLTERAFVLVPLAEIAPELVDPRSGKTIAELARGVDASGVSRREGGLVTRIRRDVQEARPLVPLALNRVGVEGVRTLLCVRADGGDLQQTLATLDVYVDLDAQHAGVHMSRFSQDLEDALAELTCDGQSVDALAAELARRVVESQNAERAEVRVRAALGLRRHTPVSALPVREFYTILGRAAATPRGTRRAVGVEVEGMTACPCAQSMFADWSRERLLAEGFAEAQVDKVLSLIPMPTHNQRGCGTLIIGSEQPVEVAQLVEIVEQSMSSETYDLLKRPDELFVVTKAHHSPRFVEDVVREMLRYVHDALTDLPDDSFVFARQRNDESIHKHDAVAETSCTLGELRRELRGESVAHTTFDEWLYRIGGGDAAHLAGDGRRA